MFVFRRRKRAQQRIIYRNMQTTMDERDFRRRNTSIAPNSRRLSHARSSLENAYTRISFTPFPFIYRWISPECNAGNGDSEHKRRSSTVTDGLIDPVRPPSPRPPFLQDSLIFYKISSSCGYSFYSNLFRRLGQSPRVAGEGGRVMMGGR